MRILLHDYGGYAFIAGLSRRLAKRGHHVLHLHASHNPTPRGRLSQEAGDPSNLRMEGLGTSGVLQKGNLIARWWEERRYGRVLTARVRAAQPEVVLSANTPLDAQWQLQRACHDLGIPFVYWVQDLIGEAMSSILARRLGFLGSLIGNAYARREARLLEGSRAVVVIAESFREHLERRSIRTQRLEVIPNWAPIDELPVMPRDNPWSRAHGWNDRFCFLYSGSLGLKHDVAPLRWLIRKFTGRGAAVLIVSEGEVAQGVREQMSAEGFSNFDLMPFQPMSQYPQVMGTGDVLVAILEESTGQFSVPSKVLSYLCAQRPILMAAPADNPTSRMVTEAEAGLVVGPRDKSAFLQAARTLKSDDDLRAELASNGRELAERAFNPSAIADRFERLIAQISAGQA